ncbi:unnamed protein product [Periconia digitata]|uniref:RlpA-like protein double-psi beta-barrel domain-containing protein n=1 Tax=Periconia digitata TaxID=1303443 RepID=A0A9W4UKL5_9PLEO|nr:unnamed protein product [Periconia digitata]
MRSSNEIKTESPEPIADITDEPSKGWNLEGQTQTNSTNKRHRFACIPITWTWVVSEKFDRLLPPHKPILGLKRKTFCLILLAILLCILGIAIGVPVGLSRNKDRIRVSKGNPDGNFFGDLTYFAPAMGACGLTNTENDAIVAISHERFDQASIGSNPNNNPLCNKKIRITRGGNSVDVRVVDRCTGCKFDDLDVTIAVFTKLADEAQGRVDMTWSWL